MTDRHKRFGMVVGAGMMKSILSYFLGIVGLLFFLGLGIQTQDGMPDNATVYFDTKNNVYISPPCFAGGDFKDHESIINQYNNNINSRFILVKFSKIRDINGERSRDEKIHRDQICNNNIGFQEDMTVIESIFIGHPIISGERWNLDGSWNW
jgi:hypothetical protein